AEFRATAFGDGGAPLVRDHDDRAAESAQRRLERGRRRPRCDGARRPGARSSPGSLGLAHVRRLYRRIVRRFRASVVESATTHTPEEDPAMTPTPQSRRDVLKAAVAAGA